MYFIFRVVINTLISAAIIWIADSIGWITLSTESMPYWQAIILVAIIMNLVMMFTGWVYALFILGTCFIGCLLFPVYLTIFGWVAIWGTAHVAPNLLTIQIPFWWHGLVLSIILGLVRIPDVNVKISETSSQ